MKILIKVTKEILERSKMCGTTDETRFEVSKHCAITLAAQEIFPGCSTQYQFIRLENGNKIYHPASDFVFAFDEASPANRAAMPEFSFEIDVPQEVIEKIGINEVYKILSESKTLELVQP